MLEVNKEITKKKCNECGEAKTDVEFRTWNGVDAIEWDTLCASCAEKKERNTKYFLVFYTGFVVVGIIFIMLLAYAAATSIFT